MHMALAYDNNRRIDHNCQNKELRARAFGNSHRIENKASRETAGYISDNSRPDSMSKACIRTGTVADRDLLPWQ
jgi:hypothetical protein